MYIRRYTFTKSKITAVLVDDPYIWYSFKGNGNTTLRKTSASNPRQTYFTLTPSVSEIVKIKKSSNYIFCVVKDEDYLLLKYSKTTPYTDNSTIAKPSGEIENPVDLVIGASSLYILMPGSTSGEIPRILKYNLSSLALEDTINLEESGIDLSDAIGMTKDSEENLWVVTKTDPTKLIKVTNGSWALKIENIT